ncbi:hypothetical protein IE53DRAFT_366293, partial [Violaceomyces palustris]
IIGIGQSYKHNWPQGLLHVESSEGGVGGKPRPLLFLKPTSSYAFDRGSIEVPFGCRVYHEVELAIVIAKSGRDIPIQEAEDYIAGFALALDMTAKNVQSHARSEGLPWTTSKGLDTFTPISDFIPRSKILSSNPTSSSSSSSFALEELVLEFYLDSKLIQRDSPSSLIYTLQELISYSSSIMTLEKGDVILTGSPDKVGPVAVGQTVNAFLRRLPKLSDGESPEGQVLASLEMEVVDRVGGFRFDQGAKH